MSLPKKSIALLSFVFLVFSTVHATQFFNTYWIGNSLSQGSPGCIEGWGYTQTQMIDPDSAKVHMWLNPSAMMRGATDLPAHWRADIAGGDAPCNTARGDMMAPSGCRIWDPYVSMIKAQDHYDYVVLQGFLWSAPFKPDIDTASLYADFALNLGTKPIFMACWQKDTAKALYDPVVAAYDSLYRKYRAQGALLAPIMQAHRLVYLDHSKVAATYLYNAGEPFYHPNHKGGYLNMCVFYELFTGQPYVGDSSALRARCNEFDVPIADMRYLEGIANQAIANYYGAAGIAKLGVTVPPTRMSNPIALHTRDQFAAPSQMRAFDLTGRRIVVMKNMTKSGLIIVQERNVSGACHIVIYR